MPKVLVFYPKRLKLGAGGSAQRALEVLTGLRALGCKVILASSALYTRARWDSASIELLERNYVDHLCLYTPTRADLFYARILRKGLVQLFQRKSSPAAFRAPPGMKLWFKRLANHWRPDVVLVNYIRWDGLVDQVDSNVTKVIDTLDLMTMGEAMGRQLGPHFSEESIRRGNISELVLREDFFDSQEFAANEEEFRLLDKYDFTISISSREHALVQKHCRRTRPLYIPMTTPAIYLENSYHGNAVFPSGRHLFVRQGYYYFVQRVLPHVLERAPDFHLDVTGENNPTLIRVNGIRLTGFVPDLKTLFVSSSFLVCPILGGTGQPTKIIEGMAHGLAVVTTEYGASTTPVTHRVNGLVARNAEEFAEYTLELWRDRDLCRRLGQAARETIAEEYSPQRLLDGLSSFLV